MTCLDYIDDSGSIDHGGPIIFGGVEVRPQGWRTALQTGLMLGKIVVRRLRIAVSQELRATEFVNSHSRISIAPPTQFIGAHNGITFWNDLGREVA